MFIYFLKTVQSFHIIFSQKFFILLGQSFIQKNRKVSAESFWVILGLILLVFLYLLRVVKPFLIKVCKNVFCITPILTVLNIFCKSFSPGSHFRVFFGLSCCIFLYFLRTVWPLKKKYSNILLIIHCWLSNSKTLWGVLPFAWRYLDFFFRGRAKGQALIISLYIFRKV